MRTRSHFGHTRRPAPGEQGQEALEFALIFPLLFLVLMGIFDLGRVTYYGSVLHNAAREGARYGSIRPADTAGIEAAVQQLAVGIAPGAMDITITQPDADTLQVLVEYDLVIATPLISSFFGGSGALPLVSQATMRIEK